jgi:hypothetical protein
MAFSTRRGGWAQTLLPFSSPPNPKSKHVRKPRRRLALRDFIFTNFFAIGLTISFFFFLIVVLRYGVPRPISSHFKSRPSRFPKSRKPVYRKSDALNDTVFSSTVDITTKELYDRIEFRDIDGGPWKQGWRVSYKGDEWDSEKLKVFVVPHSHNDPGWKLTVEEYYERQSRLILDTIVETLSKVKWGLISYPFWGELWSNRWIKWWGSEVFDVLVGFVLKCVFQCEVINELVAVTRRFNMQEGLLFGFFCVGIKGKQRGLCGLILVFDTSALLISELIAVIKG